MFFDEENQLSVIGMRVLRVKTLVLIYSFSYETVSDYSISIRGGIIVLLKAKSKVYT